MVTKKAVLIGLAGAAAVAGLSLTVLARDDAQAKGNGGQGRTSAGAPARSVDGSRAGTQYAPDGQARQGAGRGANGRNGGSSSLSPRPAVTPELTAVLTRAMQEEQLAKDTYDAVLAKLGQVRPFTMIARSEAQHIAAIDRVAAANGVTLTYQPLPVPSIPASLAAAAALGVRVEQEDIALYDELLPQVQQWPEVVRLFTNLRTASEDNHLPAFETYAG